MAASSASGWSIEQKAQFQEYILRAYVTAVIVWLRRPLFQIPLQHTVFEHVGDDASWVIAVTDTFSSIKILPGSEEMDLAYEVLQRQDAFDYARENGWLKNKSKINRRATEGEIRQNFSRAGPKKSRPEPFKPKRKKGKHARDTDAQREDSEADEMGEDESDLESEYESENRSENELDDEFETQNKRLLELRKMAFELETELSNLHKVVSSCEDTDFCDAQEPTKLLCQKPFDKEVHEGSPSSGYVRAETPRYGALLGFPRRMSPSTDIMQRPPPRPSSERHEQSQREVEPQLPSSPIIAPLGIPRRLSPSTGIMQQPRLSHDPALRTNKCSLKTPPSKKKGRGRKS